MLKAALARKDGEAEHIQQPSSSGHVTPKLKSYASSPPLQRNWPSSGGRKVPKDDSSSIMVTCYSYFHEITSVTRQKHEIM